MTTDVEIKDSSTSIFKRISSALFTRRQEIPSAVADPDPQNKGTAVVVSRAKQATGEYPKILAKARLMNYYYVHPKVKTVTDTIRLQIKSRGYYYKCKNPKAKKALEQFTKRARLGHVIDTWITEGIVTGDSFTEMLSPDNLQNLGPVPISTIWKIDRNEDGSYKTIWQLNEGDKRALDPRNFIHFKLIDLPDQAFGIGLIHALATPQLIDGDFRPSALDNHLMMTDAMVRAIETHIAPLITAYYENASDDFLEQEASKIKNARNGGYYLTNKKPEWTQLAIDPRARFEAYIAHMDDLVDAGLAHPVIRLLTNPSALADAQAAADIMEPFLFGIESTIKELIDTEIIPRVLTAAGILDDGENEFLWGKEDESDFNVEEIFTALNTKVGNKPTISIKEARMMLREKFRWPLEENTPLDQEDDDDLIMDDDPEPIEGKPTQEPQADKKTEEFDLEANDNGPLEGQNTPESKKK